MSGPQRGRHLPLQLDRLADDADAARADGCAFVRLDLPWATAQPVPGRLNGEVVEVAEENPRAVAVALVDETGGRAAPDVGGPVGRGVDGDGGGRGGIPRVDRVAAGLWRAERLG